MPGRYIPQCKKDGSFEEVQCHPSTGYCWCVDTAGWELEGTKIRGTPSCHKSIDYFIGDFPCFHRLMVPKTHIGP